MQNVYHQFFHHEWRATLCRMRGLVELLTIEKNEEVIQLLKLELMTLDKKSREFSNMLEDTNYARPVSDT